ncbi:MAG: hypothetical protein P1P80_04965, partial [ANME-2 cluster archaeon]|nr:hypothetical protein [ANME-2 cluster archaeon]
MKIPKTPQNSLSRKSEYNSAVRRSARRTLPASSGHPSRAVNPPPKTLSSRPQRKCIRIRQPATGNLTSFFDTGEDEISSRT